MIALMQEDTRIDRDEGGKNLSIGYYIMKVSRAYEQKLFELFIFFSWGLFITLREKRERYFIPNIYSLSGKFACRTSD